MPKPKNVNGYIAAAPPKARAMMKQLRRAITTTAPQAEEKISYGMPYYGYYGRVAYFAAFKNHISFFIMGRAQKKFSRELEPYKTSTATLQFPIGTKIPLGLIRKVVKDRINEIDQNM